MRRDSWFFACLCAAALIAVIGGQATAYAPAKTPILRFSTMYGVNSPFLGGPNSFRGIPGDTMPWMAGGARGSLSVEGRLLVRIRGLVHQHESAVPTALRGMNDRPTLRAVVSCQSIDRAGQMGDRNIITEAVPVTPSGDADIDTMVVLPEPCIAPAVMIVSGNEQEWLAVTGYDPMS